jgi:hypothetical protein
MFSHAANEVKQVHRRVIGAAAVFTLTACLADPVFPVSDRASVRLHLESYISPCHQELADQHPAISGAEGEIRGSGVLVVPSGGYELAPGLLVESDGTVVLTVAATLSEGGVGITLCHPYSLAVRSLQSGTYDVVLVHKLTTPRRSAEVMSARVRVK